MGYWHGTDGEPIASTGTTTANYTYCCNWSGIPSGGYVTKIQIYSINAGTFEFASFVRDGSSFTDQSWITGISVDAASLQTFTASGGDWGETDLPVNVGDWLGHYSSTGTVERTASVGPGYFYDSGDQIGDGNPSTFTTSSTTRELQYRFWIETGPRTYDVSTSDGIVLGESITTTGPWYSTATDGLEFGETVTIIGVSHVSVTDGLEFGESILETGPWHLSASSGIEFGDDTTLFYIGPSGSYTWGWEPLNRSWQTFSDGASGNVTTYGDADWGHVEFGNVGEIAHSPVMQISYTSPQISITRGVYSGETVGSGTIKYYIRGSLTRFNQDAVSPAWRVYTGTVSQEWIWVQFKVEAE
jgi:hypothetical protein